MKWASNSIVVKFAEQALMRYLVKGFSKIKNCQGVIALKGICYVVNCGQQLCFSAPFCPKAMLGVNKNTIIHKVFHYVDVYNVLQNLSCSTGQRNWPIVSGLLLSPFLKMQHTFASLQHFGNFPSLVDAWKMSVKMGRGKVKRTIEIY